MSSSSTCLRSSQCVAKAQISQKQAFGRLPGLAQRRTSRSIPTQSKAVTVRQRSVQAHAVQEIYEAADLAGFIGGTAATIFAMTLVGLAIGFVLLRFEALVEEGKIV